MNSIKLTQEILKIGKLTITNSLAETQESMKTVRTRTPTPDVDDDEEDFERKPFEKYMDNVQNVHGLPKDFSTLTNGNSRNDDTKTFEIEEKGLELSTLLIPKKRLVDDNDEVCLSSGLCNSLMSIRLTKSEKTPTKELVKKRQRLSKEIEERNQKLIESDKDFMTIQHERIKKAEILSSEKSFITDKEKQRADKAEKCLAEKTTHAEELMGQLAEKTRLYENTNRQLAKTKALMNQEKHRANKAEDRERKLKEYVIQLKSNLEGVLAQSPPSL